MSISADGFGAKLQSIHRSETVSVVFGAGITLHSMSYLSLPTDLL
ncbi:unnamed protein product [Musa acuminata var. zebrina]